MLLVVLLKFALCYNACCLLLRGWVAFADGLIALVLGCFVDVL